MRISESLMNRLKHIAIDSKKTIGDLVEEAIRDFVKKYELKAPSKKGNHNLK